MRKEVEASEQQVTIGANIANCKKKDEGTRRGNNNNQKKQEQQDHSKIIGMI